MVHCDTERLRLLLADQLPDSLQVEMAEHVASCESCRRTLESLAGDARWWSEVETCLRSGVAQERHSTGSSAVNSASEGEASGSADEFGVDFGIDFLDACDRAGALGRLGEYEILEVIGRGGMDVVLKGFHRELGRFVAVKVMAPHLASSGAARQRFIREARAAAAIVHSNVMPIHSVCTTARLPYLVMPFAACESLQQRIDRQGPLELKEILRIGVQAASGLAAAHAQGLVHRDVKPANILLEKGVDRVLLTDFGLARAADDGSLTRSGVVAGTPQYMSPEQSRGDPTDARSDLFSLGSVVYAASAGHPPFRAETALGVLRRISDAEPRPIREVNPDVPAWLEGLVCRLHEKSPDRRFGSAAEVASLLEQCLAHLQQPDAVPLPASLAPTSAIPPKRQRISQLKGTLAMIASIGICLLGSFLWQGSAKPRLADLLSTRLGEDEDSSFEPALTTSWPSFRGRPSCDGVSGCQLPDDPAVVWKRSFVKTSFEATAAIADGVVYIGALDGGNFLALDLATGATKWKYPTNLGFKAAAAVRDGVVYVGDTDGKFYAFDAATGNVKWSLAVDGEISAGANFYRDKLLFTCEDGNLRCVELATGKRIWNYSIDSPLRCSPCVSGDRAFLAGCDGRLHVVNLKDGTAFAQIDVQDPTLSTPSAVGSMVYLGTQGSRFCGVNWRSQRIDWMFEPKNKGQQVKSSAAVANGLVVFGGKDRLIHALDAATGMEVWSTPVRAPIDSSPVVAGRRVFIGTDRGELVSLDLKSGKQVWQYEAGGRFDASPAVADGKLVIGNDAGDLYCFGGNGDDENYKLQGHDPVGAPGVVDRTLPGPPVATTPPRQSDSQTTPTEHKTNEVELEFTFPAGAVLAVNDDESLTSPGRLNLASRGLHVLTLRNIPDHPELKLSVVFAVWSIIPETEAYLRQHSVPLNLTAEDIQRAAAGEPVKKAVYLPHEDRKHAETLVSSQLEPGVEPQEEAWRRGHVLVGLKVLPYPKAVAPLATSSTEHAANAERKPLILIGHADWVTGVAFSPDGKFVASSSRDKTVKVWEAATGLELLTLNRQVDNVNQRGDGYVQAVAFSPDGKKVASAGPGNNAVDVWNVVSGRRGRSHVRESIFMSVAFSPAGRLLAAANYNSVKVWDDDQDDPEGSNEILSLDASMPLSVAFSLDGKRLAAGGRDNKIKVWNTVTGEELLTVQNADQVLYVAFSPDGTRLASVCPTGVDVRDATTGKMVLMLNGLIGISGVAYSPDGKRLATAGWDKLVKLWDATTGQELRALKGHGNAVGGVAFSPDGKRLASSSKDRTVRIWDVAP